MLTLQEKYELDLIIESIVSKFHVDDAEQKRLYQIGFLAGVETITQYEIDSGKLIGQKSLLYKGLLWQQITFAVKKGMSQKQPIPTPKRRSLNYWQGEKGRERAIIELRNALERTEMPKDFYPRLMTEDFLKKFGLHGAIQAVFKHHPYDYLNAAYPNVFMPWEMPYTPSLFFDNPRNVVAATKWLVEKKLGYNISELSREEIWRQQIAAKISKEDFCDHGLRVIMKHYGSPQIPMKMTYPGMFFPWSFQSKTKWRGKKGKRVAAIATRWVIERYAKISPDYKDITCSFFMRNGLWGMLTSKILGFNCSPKKALENAYPRHD